MKQLIIILSALLFTSESSLSQTGWIHQNSNLNKNLTEVFFVNASTGWIVTDSSKVLKTTNSGVTWSIQTLPYYSPLKTVFFLNENTGWVAGGYYYFAQSGVIYKTTNGGNNWITLSYSGNFQSIYFINENTGFAGFDGSYDFSSGGSLAKTTNGGMNWTGNYFNYIIRSINFEDTQTGYAVGHYWDDTGNDSAIILRTTNSGEVWETKYKERNYSFYYGVLKDIISIGNEVWAGGRDSSILYSSNSGENWIMQYIPVPRVMNSIFFIDNNTGWAVGRAYTADTSNVIKTTNGGQNWFNLRNNYNTWLNSVMFVDENTGWAVGENGLILKTTTGGLTFVNNNFTQSPTEFTLYQNYPNPFNPVTNLEFGISQSGFVSLRVFDALGKEVITLVNETKQPGSYTVQFDGSDLASGLYFYKLEAGEFTETKRMILLK